MAWRQVMSTDQEKRPTIKGIAFHMVLWAASFVLCQYVYDNTHGFLKAFSTMVPWAFLALLVGYSLAGSGNKGLFITISIALVVGFMIGLGILPLDTMYR